MIISTIEQGSEDWLESRLGRPSASQFSKLITAAGKPSSQADGYINQLIAERVSGERTPVFVSDWMLHGTENEPFARSEFEFIFDIDVQQVGFCTDDSGEYGCSPDGLIDTTSGFATSGVEFKCPAPATQIGYQRDPMSGVRKYWQQLQGCMFVTGAKSWEFFSYHPTLAHVHVTVARDDDFITALAEQVKSAVEIIKIETEKRKCH